MKRQNLVWLALFLFGAIGLASNALLRPHGFGKAYVRDVTRSFVEVQAGPPIGGDPGEATRTIWVPADSDELHRPNIARTAAAPISSPWRRRTARRAGAHPRTEPGVSLRA